MNENNLPNDPAMLLSVVNTKLRDYYTNLDALCEDMQTDKLALTQKLRAIDYEYNDAQNQFI